MATVKQTLVHFASELALPPVDRPKVRVYDPCLRLRGSPECTMDRLVPSIRKLLKAKGLRNSGPRMICSGDGANSPRYPILLASATRLSAIKYQRYVPACTLHGPSKNLIDMAWKLVLEGNDDRVILFNASKTQQDGYPTLTLTGSMTLAHAVDQTAANNLRTRPFVSYHPTHNFHHAANRSVTLKMSGTSSDGAGNSACLAGFLQDSKELGAVDGGRTSFCRVV
jgi:hypothetical protein